MPTTLQSGRAMMTMTEKITSRYAADSTPRIGRPHRTAVKKHETAATKAAPSVPSATSVKREPVHRSRVSRFRAGRQHEHGGDHQLHEAEREKVIQPQAGEHRGSFPPRRGGRTGDRYGSWWPGPCRRGTTRLWVRRSASRTGRCGCHRGRSSCPREWWCGRWVTGPRLRTDGCTTARLRGRGRRCRSGRRLTRWSGPARPITRLR